MGIFNKNTVMLGAATLTGLILFISYTLDLAGDYETAGNVAFVAIPAIMLATATFWATSEVYSGAGNDMKMKGISGVLTILLGAYLAYLITEYKDSAKNPFLTPGHGTRSVSKVDEFKFFLQFDVNFDDNRVSYTKAQEDAVLSHCDRYLQTPTLDDLGKCALFTLNDPPNTCKWAPNAKTLSDCFTSFLDQPVDADISVQKPTFKRSSTTGNVKSVKQIFVVNFKNADFKDLITSKNCLEVNYSNNPECVFGFNLKWTFMSPLLGNGGVNPAGLTYRQGLVSDMGISLNRVGAEESHDVLHEETSLFPVAGNTGGEIKLQVMTDWMAEIDLKRKETLLWRPKKFKKLVDRSANGLFWEVSMFLLTKKDLTIPVETRTQNVRLPFFAIFTALMSFITPLGAVFAFFYPDVFPKRYAKFGEKPAFFDELDKGTYTTKKAGADIEAAMSG